MDREQIIKRLNELRAAQAQLQANLNATTGAIQDCEYWLAQLDAELPKAAPEASKEKKS